MILQLPLVDKEGFMRLQLILKKRELFKNSTILKDLSYICFFSHFQNQIRIK